MAGDDFHRLGIAGRADEFGAGQVFRQPATTLGQGLAVGIDGGDGGQIAAGADEVLFDAHLHFAADGQRVIEIGRASCRERV